MVQKISRSHSRLLPLLAGEPRVSVQTTPPKDAPGGDRCGRSGGFQTSVFQSVWQAVPSR